MASPETIQTILGHPTTQRLLRYLTERRGKTCLLEEALRSFGKKGLDLKQRLSFAAPHGFARLIAKLAGADGNVVSDKISVHGARVRALVNTCRSVGEYGLTHPQKFSAPLMVVWNFTQACNYKCKHCYQDAHKRLEDELTLGEKYALVEMLAHHDVCMIAFSGGEPLMGEGFYETARHAHALGLHMTVATNGSLLTPENCRRLLDVGIKYAEISLDSLDPETHDKFRGGTGYWKRSVQGIRNAIATPELRTGVAMTVTKLNFDELENMIRWSIDEGANVFYAFNFIPTGRGKGIAGMDLTPDQREEMLGILHKYLCGREIDVMSSAPQFGRACMQYVGPDGLVNTGHYGMGQYSTAKVLAKYVGGCGAGRLYHAIQPNGDVTPCVFMPEKVGNIRENDYMDLWKNHAVMQSLRERDDLKGHCLVCEYKYHCGGCRARPYGYYGDMKMPDPGCVRNRDAWEELTSAMPEEAVAVESVAAMAGEDRDGR